MQIRPAVLDDSPEIARIHVDAWRAAYAGILPIDVLASLSVAHREAMWRVTIESRSARVDVVRDDDQMLGWVCTGQCRDEDTSARDAEIWAIYVKPGAQRRGVGRAMWNHVRQILRGQSFQTCRLWVLSGNSPAIKFYKSLGFRADAVPVKTITIGTCQVDEVRYVIELS